MKEQKRRFKCGLVFGFFLATTSILEGQPQAAGTAMNLAQAVDSALRNYPSITVSQEQVNAAAAGIDLARTAYLPRVDSLAQVNRATRNNIFGLYFPTGVFTTGVIPAISGPVLGTNNFGTVWGSAVGTFVTWEPFDFGLRRANVSAATAVRTRTQATLNRTQFDATPATQHADLT